MTFGRARLTLLLWVVLLVAGIAAACGGASSTSPSAGAVPFSQTDLSVGTGAEATTGRTATVHYTLWLYDTAAVDHKGPQIETSVGGQPFSFALGAGRVIRGWDQGVVGMRAGGRRRLVLPPDLAYGSAGAPPSIPPNATLVFDIELISVQ